MTTTSTFSGMEENKPSSRVLKPPGGGSSNIFGSEAPAIAPTRATPQGASKRSDAGIFNPSASDSSLKNAQRTARDGDNSFSRLFGDFAASPPAISQKGTGVSQRVNTHDNLFGDSGSSPQSSTPTVPTTTHDHIFGDQTAALAEGATGSYNPITGAEYRDLAPNHHALHVKEVPKAQKEQPPLPCSDGEFQAKEGKMQNVQTSTRVTNPPGGKTHKLW